MSKRRPRSKSGIGYGIAMFVLTIVFCAIIWVALNGAAISPLQSWASSLGPGIFDPSSETWMYTMWAWFMVMVLFGSVIWLFNQAQKRGPADY